MGAILIGFVRGDIKIDPKNRIKKICSEVNKLDYFYLPLIILISLMLSLNLRVIICTKIIEF